MNREVHLRAEQLSNLGHHQRHDVGVHAILEHPAVRRHLKSSIHLTHRGRRFRVPQFVRHVDEIYEAHVLQTDAQRRDLSARWSLRNRKGGRVGFAQVLHFTVDHTDRFLMYTSQFIHCLQVFGGIVRADDQSDPAMEGLVTDGTRSDLEIGALIHDLGKTLTLFGERDGNVDCMNRIVRFVGNGLDGVVAQWNHDEFAFKTQVLHATLSWGARHPPLSLPSRVCRYTRRIGVPVPDGYRVRSRGSKDADMSRGVGWTSPTTPTQRTGAAAAWCTHSACSTRARNET